MRWTLLPLALATLAALAGCDATSEVDRTSPTAVARAYATADHELDHGRVYDLLGPEVLDGASRSEWVAGQQPDGDDPSNHYLSRRYRDDRCNARREGPREVTNVSARDQGEGQGWPRPAGLRVVQVGVEFAEGEALECLYGLRETPEGRFEVVRTEEP